MKNNARSLLVYVLLALVELLVCNYCYAEYGSDGHQLNRNIDFEGEPALMDQEQIRAWVKQELAKKLGISGENSLRVNPRSFSLNDQKIVAIEQVYRSLPIVGMESRLALNQQQRPLFLLGKHRNIDGEYSNQPTLSPEEALEAAGRIDNQDYQHRLIFWTKDGKQLILSYELSGYFGANSENSSALKIYIDAESGKILQKLPMTFDKKNRQVSDFNAACNALGINRPINFLGSTTIELLAVAQHSRRENQSAGNNQDINRAYELLGDGYDFLHQVIGMDSIDGRGRLLSVFINVRYNEQVDGPQCTGSDFNAQWQSLKQSLYIPREGLDLVEVTLHELGHGVISNGSNLEYAFQPGALNEAIADAIGVSFRIWRDLGMRSTQVDNIPAEYWQIRAPNKIIRSMSNPSSVQAPYAYPDHFDAYYNWDSSRDHGGVHFNSSIINMAFYLLAQGGQHPRLQTGPNVEGIGVFKAAQIYAQAGHQLLQVRSDFEDARYAFARAAELMFGRDSQERESVHLSMDAVGIAGQWERSNLDAQPEENPVPAPEPEAEPKEPVQNEEQLPQTQAPPQKKENNFILLTLLASGGLGISLLLMMKMRPKYEQTLIARQPSEAPRHEQHDELKTRPDSNQISSSLQAINNLELRSLYGKQCLPLKDKYLRSREGLVVGRALDIVHIHLDSNLISRRHLRFRYQGSVLSVEDLNSSHGTYVDGRKIEPFLETPLHIGQLLRIAEYSYTIRAMN